MVRRRERCIRRAFFGILAAMRLLSPRDLADALGVSESSLKRWIDAGKIEATRTEGGHRRILLGEAVRFIRESGAPLARPELLGLPEVAYSRLRPDGGRLVGYLVDGDAVGARGWLMARYLAGASSAEWWRGCCALWKRGSSALPCATPTGAGTPCRG